MHNSFETGMGSGDFPPFLIPEAITASIVDTGVSTRQVFRHYQKALQRSSHCKKYLESLGISFELAESCELGYADRTLGFDIPLGRTEEGAVIRGALQRRGLFKPSGHELFRGALVVPVLDTDGDIVAAYGRRIAPKINPGVDKELFWKQTDTPLYLGENHRYSRDVILCQNPLDALIFKARGYTNAMASMGLSSFSEAHLDAMAESRVEVVTMVFENTHRGSHYARLVAQSLNTLGIYCRRALPPEGSTLVNMVRETSDISACLQGLLSKARPCRQIYEGLLGAIRV